MSSEDPKEVNQTDEASVPLKTPLSINFPPQEEPSASAEIPDRLINSLACFALAVQMKHRHHDRSDLLVLSAKDWDSEAVRHWGAAPCLKLPVVSKRAGDSIMETNAERDDLESSSLLVFQR